MPLVATFCNGAEANAADLRALALRNYGHFTTMQVRGGAVRGLDLHVARLRAATRELFDVDLDDVRVRGCLRHALDTAGLDDCSARMTVFARGFDLDDPLRAIEPDVLVSLSGPLDRPRVPLRVLATVLDRPLPHLKHLATLPLVHARREARRAGFDDALLVDAAGQVREGATWNIGFRDGDRVVWPEAPMLRGTTQQMLEAGLAGLGVPQARQGVRLDEVGRFDGAFAAYSRGVFALAAIGDVRFESAGGSLETLEDALARWPLDPV